VTIAVRIARPDFENKETFAESVDINKTQTTVVDATVAFCALLGLDLD